MADEHAEKKRKKPSLRDLWRLIVAIVVAIAIVQELRKPPEERSWHGKVGFFPYDFRRPTFERFREALWNPEGSFVQSKAFGVGWTVNLGAIKRWVSVS